MPTSATIELDGQYRLLREEAGLVDRSERGKLVVSGAEAADYLQGQLTNDVESLEPGRGCYAALLDRKGHMQGDMRVLRVADDRFWIDAEPCALPAVRRHLDVYRIGREVEIADVSAERAMLSVIGPAAAELTGIGPLGPEHAHRLVELAGIEERAVTTELGFDSIVGADRRDALVEALGEDGVAEVSEHAAEILRVEAGIPRFGAEMTTKTIPQEAGLDERALSFTKGCYIGQETVARLHYRGKPNRHLRGLKLSAPAEHGDAIRLGDRELGQVGTAVLSPARGPIALAVVRREAEPGAEVEIGERGDRAEVVELPFE